MSANEFFYRKVSAVAKLIAIALALVIAAEPARAQTESVILKLTASTGQDPAGGMIADSAGNLYGTALIGGPGGYGTVFELSPPTVSGGVWTETNLHAFSGAPDGFSPVGPLILDKAGNLYGTTSYGGLGVPYNYGIVFELSPPVVAGDPWSETILYTFQTLPDGQTPNGGLVMDGAGNLYGTTTYGGACGWGTVFEVSPPATSGGPWAEKVIYSFRYTCNGKTYYDAASPGWGLVMGSDGALYGIAGGGATYDGTVFKLNPPAAGHTAWTEKILYTLTGGSDGSDPAGSLVIHHGNLYGTAFDGGNSACFSGCGTIFELSPPSVTGGAWTETTVYSFTGGTDGANPEWSVLFDKQGNLYAAARDGGNAGCEFTAGCGAVIKLAPPAAKGDPWTETTLFDFAGRGDGGETNSALVIGKFDRLYGTTLSGGDASCTYWGYTGCGVVFKIIP
jgi:uncharacterized repeat protein (TIGR03803 family)